MKIVLATESFYPNISGVSVSTFLLAQSLVSEGHDVWIFAPSPDGKEREEKLDGSPQLQVIRFRSVPNPFRRGFRVTLMPRRSVARHLRAIHPDIIHLQDPVAIATATLQEARRLNKPVIATVHFSLEYVLAYLWFLGPMKHLTKKLLIYRLCKFYNQCQTIITPSRTIAEKIMHMGVKRPIIPISNGVDIERFYSYIPPSTILSKYHLPPGIPIVLYVNRLDRDKSVEVFLDAIPMILQQHKAHFVIVGGGNLFKRCVKKTKKMKVGRSVTFTGPIPHESDHLPHIYQIADMFVIPSSIETQSITTLEAMASGLPVIAANAGALGELIQDGENGFLFEPGNSAALAECVNTLLAQPLLARKMGETNLLSVTKHRMEEVHSTVMKLYEKVIHQ